MRCAAAQIMQAGKLHTGSMQSWQHTESLRLMTDIMRGCRKAFCTVLPRKVFIRGSSRLPMKLPLLLLSQPPRSSLSTRVTRHWCEVRPFRYSGCKGDIVQPAEITCKPFIYSFHFTLYSLGCRTHVGGYNMLMTAMRMPMLSQFCKCSLTSRNAR